MKSLILAEKPSVAREIARVLGLKNINKSYIEGNQYIVTWALGHLIELKMPEHYDSKYKTWKLEDLPIVPEKMGLKVIKQTSHQFRAIDNLAKRKDIKEIIIATDAGREGELVARWILEKIRWKKSIKRLWISSVTDKAIRDGFKNLRPGEQFNNLYDSAVCRAEADWLIGLNVTRALTTKYEDPLSAGRVQTPSLALIINREKQIQKFVPIPYWTISAKLGSLLAVWTNDSLEQRIFSKEKAAEIVEKVEHGSAEVMSVTRKEKSEQQPLPYDLNELQRDANKRYGFSAKKTLSVLQKLYEQHKLVTYPRTDSRYLTTDMENTMLERLQALSGAYDEVRPLIQNKGKVLAKRVFNNNYVSDHHAIIPTEQRVHLSDLDNDERKIYDLIVRKFLGLFYPPYKYETVHVNFLVSGEKFTAKETIVKQLGFKQLQNTEIDATSTKLGELRVGNKLSVRSVDLEEKLTEPPLRFSEADLLGQMEKYGLGTPATRAEIIERLLETEVIERNNGRLFPTPKGKQLIELVHDELKSPELTAKWEKELELIAKGNASPKKFLANIRKQTEKLVSDIKKSDIKYRAHNLTGSKCPECGSFLKERNTKEGKILVCSNLSCSFRKHKEPKKSNRRCPQCHSKMEMHNGKAGLYFQCRKCNIVEQAEERKKSVNKREERKLVQKYTKKETFGTALGDLLKQALEEKGD
ncbi:DNA topoisomerase III [Bacillus kwashiorkori]|uniref:DNA topoisomerase III n=1 Tax=Bacillus kwashiorkori TaxID=1522318 RepID=UPI000780C9A2|nr:DNA topoisomerase III [Bacillus kwashiorkori]